MVNSSKQQYAEPIRAFGKPPTMNACKAFVDRLDEEFPRLKSTAVIDAVETYADSLPAWGDLSKAEVGIVFCQWALATLAYRKPGKRWAVLEVAQDYAEQWVSTYDRSCGGRGRLFELEKARETHRYRARWGTEGERDSARVQVVNPATGKTYSTVSVEVKTNCGNCKNIVDNVPEVVIYRLDGASHQWGHALEPRVTTGRHFIEVMESAKGFNASKEGLTIQANKKSVWLAVESLPLWQGVDFIYTIEYLEGLE